MEAPEESEAKRILVVEGEPVTGSMGRVESGSQGRR